MVVVVVAAAAEAAVVVVMVAVGEGVKVVEVMVVVEVLVVSSSSSSSSSSLLLLMLLFLSWQHNFHKSTKTGKMDMISSHVLCSFIVMIRCINQDNCTQTNVYLLHWPCRSQWE